MWRADASPLSGPRGRCGLQSPPAASVPWMPVRRSLLPLSSRCLRRLQRQQRLRRSGPAVWRRCTRFSQPLRQRHGPPGVAGREVERGTDFSQKPADLSSRRRRLPPTRGFPSCPLATWVHPPRSYLQVDRYWAAAPSWPPGPHCPCLSQRLCQRALIFQWCNCSMALVWTATGISMLEPLLRLPS